MCDPLTLSIVAAGGAALSTAGTVTQGIAARNAGRAQKRAYDEAGEAARDQALADEARFRDRARREIAQQQAAGAASGVTGVTEELLLRESVVNMAADARQLRLNGEVERSRLRNQGTLARSQGNSAFLGSLFSAAGQAAQGIASAGAMPGGFGGAPSSAGASAGGGASAAPSFGGPPA